MADPIENERHSQIAYRQRSEHSVGNISRRTMVKQVATIGAGAALSTGSVFAAMPRVDSNSRRGRIDVHHHMLPPFYMDLRRAVPDVGRMPTWSPEKSIDDMEKNGVTTAMLSLAVSGVTFDAGEAGRSLARKSNDSARSSSRTIPQILACWRRCPCRTRRAAWSKWNTRWILFTRTESLC
jgi:hypothetical protein